MVSGIVRKMAAAASVCVVVGSISACGGQSSADAAATNEPVSITINWWGSTTRAKNTEAVAKAFEQENPNIKVNLQYSDWGGYWDKLATQIAGGEAPDIIQMDQLYLSTYASQGSLLDLSQVNGEIDLSKVDDTVVKTGQLDGVQYGVPYGLGAYGVFINHDLLDRLGVELPDTDTWTWDDYAEFAKKVSDRSNGEITGGALTITSFGLQLWANQHGVPLYRDGKVAIPADSLAEFYQTQADWIANGASGTIDRWSENLTAGVEQGDLGTGKQATGIINAGRFTAYSNATGTKNVSLEPLPSDSKGKWNTYGYGPTWTISSKTQRPKEAAKLINYLINTDKSAEIQGTDRGIPVNSDVRKGLAEKATETDKKMLQYIDRIQPTIGELPEIAPNGSGDIDKNLVRHMQDVAFGKADAKSAAQAFIDEMNAAISAA